MNVSKIEHFGHYMSGVSLDRSVESVVAWVVRVVGAPVGGGADVWGRVGAGPLGMREGFPRACAARVPARDVVARLVVAVPGAPVVVRVEGALTASNCPVS